jgi:hypothetical protein
MESAPMHANKELGSKYGSDTNNLAFFVGASMARKGLRVGVKVIKKFLNHSCSVKIR